MSDNEQTGLDGPIEVGDTVETLALKRKVTGEVAYIRHKTLVVIDGTHYPGGPLVRVSSHVENLKLLAKGGPHG